MGDTLVAPGKSTRIHLPIAEHFGIGSIDLPVRVVHGKNPGPTLFVSAAIHGDEINGIEIIRRLLRRRALRRLSGTLLAVPVVNVYGFASQSRYLPDRRDLNRSFPGSPKGSLAARLAHDFTTHIVDRCTHGIDLHTAAIYRSNLPHIRACLDQPQCRELAFEFGAPVVVDANLRDGSLRQAVAERDLPMLLYEAGEALRFDEVSIRAGLRGILRVMAAIGMLPESTRPKSTVEPIVANRSAWLRAPQSGMLRTRVRLGAQIRKGETLGFVRDPAGDNETPVEALVSGVLIGRTETPLVNEGDAVFHVGVFDTPSDAAENVEIFHAEIEEGASLEPPSDRSFDEDREP
jgi:predicted deacylase